MVGSLMIALLQIYYMTNLWQKLTGLHFWTTLYIHVNHIVNEYSNVVMMMMIVIIIVRTLFMVLSSSSSATARADTVYLMNVWLRQAAAKHWTKPIESACKAGVHTHRHHHYLARKLVLVFTVPRRIGSWVDTWKCSFLTFNIVVL